MSNIGPSETTERASSGGIKTSTSLKIPRTAWCRKTDDVFRGPLLNIHIRESHPELLHEVQTLEVGAGTRKQEAGDREATIGAGRAPTCTDVWGWRCGQKERVRELMYGELYIIIL